MTLTQLNYFIALAEHRNFSAAAKACGVSQPTLSAQFHKLEEELGHTLVDRKCQPLELSSMGQSLLEQAKRTVHSAGQIHQMVDQFEHPLTGQLRLGMVAPLSKKLGPGWIAQCQRTFPALDLQVFEANSTELQQLMQQAELDAAILPMDSWKGQGQNLASFEEAWWALGPAINATPPPLADAASWVFGSEMQEAARYALSQGYVAPESNVFLSNSVASRVAVAERLGRWLLISETELDSFGLALQKRAQKWPGPPRTLGWIRGVHARNQALQSRLLAMVCNDASEGMEQA